MNKMRILISNDDSLDSEGLEILQDFAHSLTDDVWTVVPEAQRSAGGHGITIYNPLKLKKVKERVYTSNGTPADSVILALNHLLKDHKPTWVFSGINQGENIGDDVFYSGTIAAAREAALHGMKAIAFSQSYIQNYGLNFTYARDHVKEAFEAVKDLDYTHSIYNVNFPPYREGHNVKGIKFLPQSTRLRKDLLEKRIDPRNNEYFWLNVFVDHFEDKGEKIKDDVDAMAMNYISITPVLSWNLTNFDDLKKYENNNQSW
jgi:5'-nucleotidase